MADAGSQNTYTVERSTTVSAPAETVYGAIVDFHRWIDWSPWEGMDATMHRSYSGPHSGPGASYAWKGNRKVGAGTMTIVEADAPSRIAIDLAFLKPFKAQNPTTFTLTPDGDGTRVVWSMTGKKTLMTKVMGLFTSMDKLVGGDFEKGLAKLKAISEQN